MAVFDELYAQCTLYQVEPNPTTVPTWRVCDPRRIMACWLPVCKDYYGRVVTLKGRAEHWIIAGVGDVRLPRALLHDDWERGEYEDRAMPTAVADVVGKE